ncbi:MAG: hypothetical protein AAFY06_00100 [Pseudomonadota bacterium]
MLRQLAIVELRERHDVSVADIIAVMRISERWLYGAKLSGEKALKSRNQQMLAHYRRAIAFEPWARKLRVTAKDEIRNEIAIGFVTPSISEMGYRDVMF